MELEVEDCHLGIESHAQDLSLIYVYCVDNSLRHVHDQLHVEARNERAHEIGVQNLTQRDPVQRKVLILGSLEVVLERLVDWLQTEEGHWEEYGQVILRNDFHLCRVASVHEHL